MLLKSLYDFAHSRNLLGDLAFEAKEVRWIIPLDQDGNLLGAGVLETTSEKKNRGKTYMSPRTSRPKVSGGISEFLADNLTSVFNLDTDPEKDSNNPRKRQKRAANNHKKHADFWQQVQLAYDGNKHPDLAAILQFKVQIETHAQNLLYWGQNPNNETQANAKPAWWIKTSDSNMVKLGTSDLSFQVNGTLLLNDVELRTYWRDIYIQGLAQNDKAAQHGICLITGESNLPIATTHNPKIQGIPNTSAFGAAMVSFDKDAFRSYGFKQSYNAPTSTAAARAYCQALRYLLQDNDHHLRIGSASICFWAEENKEISNIISHMLNKPDPKAIKSLLQSPLAGIDRQLAKKDNFYSITLAGNAGRIIVRHWMHISVEAACINLQHWFTDLDIMAYGNAIISKKEKTPPFAMFRLACTTVREAKDLQTEVLTQLYRAALEGTAPSVMLIRPLLHRFNTDLVQYGAKTLMHISRFALLRLLLNRNRKENEPMIEPQVFETADPAYLCGRLLAIFDDLQMKAHEYKLEGAGVVERYYGSASASPNSAFGILWRLHQHHLRKVSRQGEGGKRASEAIKMRIASIAAQFRQTIPNQPPQFPRAFNLQEQGRFALGFYQQKATDDQARKNARAAKKVTRNL